MTERRFISRSLVGKLAVTCIAMVGFVLAYEVSMFDLRPAGLTRPVDPTQPATGSRLEFTATAYCKGTTTASGVGVRTGIAASDPAILPVGSVVNVSTHDPKYDGVYTIMDTGPRVQGRVLDVYMWSCHEALAFGRRPVELTVLRLGWNPNASTPGIVERLFRRREAAAQRATPAPPAQAPADVHPVNDADAASGGGGGEDEESSPAGYDAVPGHDPEPRDPAPAGDLPPSTSFAPVSPIP